MRQWMDPISQVVAYKRNVCAVLLRSHSFFLAFFVTVLDTVISLRVFCHNLRNEIPTKNGTVVVNYVHMRKMSQVR